MMARGETFHGAHHINLEKEIKRQIEELEKRNIIDISKIDVSDFIVERNKKTLMTNKEMLDFWKRKKGMA